MPENFDDMLRDRLTADGRGIFFHMSPSSPIFFNDEFNKIWHKGKIVLYDKIARLHEAFRAILSVR